ncbi:plasmid pRiA4b ORF-3 family protein [Botryobacter ruber]|uniref:plasmid pRiA4b ORF-3 family protein n=1 Tax=Botryobacter ruber TaxID=2171629 RepID=UPI000E0C6C8E|nr:plasmid pRiA4b ORF-3 family protein [Botryobacter ruber]
MKNQIYQLQIALKGFKPKIWRRVLVPSNMLLSDLHKVIQTTMGWTNSHLHQFIKDRTFYAEKSEDDDFWDEMDNVDYKKIKVSDLLKAEKDKMVYEYDFGDGWEHDVILEKILPMDKNTTLPICLTGKNSCPPEDCGGVWGYAEMLEVLKNPKHEEYESIVEWLGEEFDPTYFDKNEVNEMLQSKNYGVFEY